MAARSSRSSKPVCNHCGANYSPRPMIPLADDDAAWQEIAKEHDSKCRWVRTKAGRLSESELAGVPRK